MNTRLIQWIAALLVATPLAAVAADASDSGPPKKTPIEFLLGGDQWQPGQRYRAGNDWLALACGKSECRLEPARLAVRNEQWQGHYDEEPTDGQKLTFSRQTPGAGRVLAWFRLNKEVPWLRAGPVATYPKKRAASQGTLEMAVDLPDGREATLVPLFDRNKDTSLLQLRVPGGRQLLGEIRSCSHVVSNYLVWAGDIDGDGKPDYLINFTDDWGYREASKLYLGGQAGPGEIAGVAAVYDGSPPDAGWCDG